MTCFFFFFFAATVHYHVFYMVHLVVNWLTKKTWSASTAVQHTVLICAFVQRLT